MTDRLTLTLDAMNRTVQAPQTGATASTSTTSARLLTTSSIASREPVAVPNDDDDVSIMHVAKQASERETRAKDWLCDTEDALFRHERLKVANNRLVSKPVVDALSSNKADIDIPYSLHTAIKHDITVAFACDVLALLTNKMGGVTTAAEAVQKDSEFYESLKHRPSLPTDQLPFVVEHGGNSILQRVVQSNAMTSRFQFGTPNKRDDTVVRLANALATVGQCLSVESVGDLYDLKNTLRSMSYDAISLLAPRDADDYRTAVELSTHKPVSIVIDEAEDEPSCALCLAQASDTHDDNYVVNASCTIHTECRQHNQRCVCSIMLCATCAGRLCHTHFQNNNTRRIPCPVCRKTFCFTDLQKIRSFGVAYTDKAEMKEMQQSRKKRRTQKPNDNEPTGEEMFGHTEIRRIEAAETSALKAPVETNK